MGKVIFLSEEEAYEAIDIATDIRYGEEHRWYTDKYVVFEKDNKYYEFEYMDPATEMQEDQDWFHEIPVPCYEVMPKEKTVIVYERV